MTKISLILANIVLMLGLCVSNTFAQNVVLKGKTFIQESPKQDSIKIDYEYQDRDGVKHTIYLSSRGKAYYWATSKKTGRRYKRYLPKITEMLKEAEK
jgi:hypothetical protein